MILKNRSHYKIGAKLSNWWRIGELNSRPFACEANALPTELIPHRNNKSKEKPLINKGYILNGGE